MFGRRNNQAAAPPVIRHPLAVVPVKPANVELKRDSRGRIHLRRHPSLTGFRKTVADFLHYDYTHHVELDESGTLYYSLVDGVTALDQIIGQMTAQTGKSRREVEPSVVLFTRNLMMREMLELKVPEESAVPRSP